MARDRFYRIPLTVLLLLLATVQTGLAAPALSGYWVLEGQPEPGEIYYTDEGRRRKEAYNFMVDDLMLKCIPPSVARVWSHPGTPFEIIQNEDSVIIRYELFDMTRTISLDTRRKDIVPVPSTVDVNGRRFSTLGHSVAWYDEDAMTIETTAYSSGYVFTSTGLPQSESTRTLERITRNGNSLELTISYWDPVLYIKPYTISYLFRRYPENELLEYGCTLENASYDYE